MIRPVLTEIGIFLIPFAVYALFLLATRSGVLHRVVLAAARGRLAGARRAAAGHRQLRRCSRISPARRRTRPTSRRISRTAGWCPGRVTEFQMSECRADPARRAMAADRARPRACSALLNGDGEEARVVGGAVRNALLGIADRRHRHRHHRAAGRSDPPRQGGRHQMRADRHRARHRDAGDRRPAVRGHHACARMSRPSAARPRWRSAATGCATRERRDFTINGLSVDADGIVHDHVGGLADIAARRVRFIGDPDRAHRRGLSAHPALLPHPCRLWRMASRIAPAYLACIARPRRACHAVAPSGCGWRC